MIKLAENQDKSRIIKFIENKIEKNLYLYIDILTYGINTDFLKTWINEDDKGINQVLMKYYDSFQLLSITADLRSAANIILNNMPSMISGPKDNIYSLGEILSDNYDSTYGVVLEQNSIDNNLVSDIIEEAGIDHMKEISTLICFDIGIGGHYKTEILEEQLIKRYQDKTGRSYFIKDKNQVVAHYSTYAETDSIAVLGGLIVHPSYRGKGYAKLLHSFLTNKIISENKRVFLFCTDEDTLKMYTKFGARVVSQYGKLTLKNKGGQ